MADKILMPNAIDYVRLVNDNAVDNALGGRSAFVMLPSLYERAYTLAYETGELPLYNRLEAPEETVTAERRNEVTIVEGVS